MAARGRLPLSGVVEVGPQGTDAGRADGLPPAEYCPVSIGAGYSGIAGRC